MLSHILAGKGGVYPVPHSILNTEALEALLKYFGLHFTWFHYTEAQLVTYKHSQILISTPVTYKYTFHNHFVKLLLKQNWRLLTLTRVMIIIEELLPCWQPLECE